MKKSELRVAIQEMDTYQFGLKNELHNKLTKVTSYVPKKEVIDLVNQLEEPEQEKVVVPQFVADHIELRKKVGKRLNIALSESPEANMSEKMNISIFEANNIYARAWLDGYTVEKEKLYKIKLSEYDYLVQDEDGTIFTMDTNLHEYKNRFTEQEIKAIDERYWAFAEEVTE